MLLSTDLLYLYDSHVRLVQHELPHDASVLELLLGSVVDPSQTVHCQHQGQQDEEVEVVGVLFFNQTRRVTVRLVQSWASGESYHCW